MEDLWTTRDMAIVVDRDMAQVAFHREVFETFAEALRNNPRLRMGHFFFYIVTGWWFDSLALCFRRLTDKDHRSISLINVIRRCATDGLIDELERDADIKKIEEISESVWEIANKAIAHKDRVPHAQSMFSRWDIYWAFEALEPTVAKYVGFFVTEGERAAVMAEPGWHEDLFAIPIGETEREFTEQSWLALRSEVVYLTRERKEKLLAESARYNERM